MLMRVSVTLLIQRLDSHCQVPLASEEQVLLLVVGAHQQEHRMLQLMRQRSRETSIASTPPSLCVDELAACAAARRSRDFDRCITAANAALNKEPACGKAWAFLCWALFEQRRYDEARAACHRALAFREWALRDREGMAALCTSCLLLSKVTVSVGERLRANWYERQLRALHDSGELYAYPTVESSGYTTREGVDQEELSLLDNVSAGGMRDVCLGGDGGERDVPPGLLRGGNSQNARHPLGSCYGGGNTPLEQALTPTPTPTLAPGGDSFPSEQA